MKKLLGGDLPYEAIEDWLDSNDELPNEEKNTGINQKDSESQNQNTKENQSREDTENNNDSDYENNDETPSDESLGLPDLDAIDALNLLNSNAWATDDVEAAESLISSCLDKVWNHAYRNESEALDQVKEYKGNK